MKKFYLSIIILVLIIGAVFLMFPPAAEADAHARTDAVDPNLPLVHASEEPVILDFSFDECLASATDGPEAFNLNTFAWLVGAEIRDTNGAYDGYYILYRDQVVICAVKDADTFYIFFLGDAGYLVEVSMNYDDLDAARLLYYFATAAVPDARVLETDAEDYLPLEASYEVTVYNGEPEFSETGVILIDRLERAAVSHFSLYNLP